MATEQIRFFDKNKMDISNINASITVTDAVATDTGSAIVDNMRKPGNDSAWLTTDSTDAANTTLDFLFADERTISVIAMVLHNLKAYTIQYWNGSSYVDFSTVISETTNVETTNFYYVTEVQTDRVRLVITGAQIVDADKIIRQFIATDHLLTGQLVGWPIIGRPKHETGKRVNKMLSGKVNVVETITSFSFQLSVSNWNIDADINIIEEIYFGRRPVLVSLSGGDDSQFSHQRVGYRKEDIYLMRAIDDYSPEWSSGIYKNGLKLKIRFAEAVG